MALSAAGTRATRRVHGAHDSAWDVGKDEAASMSLRMRELEEENNILAEKASLSSQRFADYENELRVLREQLREQQQAALRAAAEHEQSAPQPDRPVGGLSRLGSFMRKPSTAPTTPHQDSAREQELEANLAKEQKARTEAEQKVKAVNAEVEELSASLFQQANDMVATERRENAGLQERIKELEKTGGNVAERLRRENERLKQKLQMVEQREVERKKRLDRLEAAQKRIDRVRTMLKPP